MKNRGGENRGRRNIVKGMEEVESPNLGSPLLLNMNSEGLQSDLIQLIGQYLGHDPSAVHLESIEIFLRRGLTENQIREALLKAFTNQSVDDPWRYFCGICWRIIRRTEHGSEGESVSDYGTFPWS